MTPEKLFKLKYNIRIENMELTWQRFSIESNIYNMRESFTREEADGEETLADHPNRVWNGSFVYHDFQLTLPGLPHVNCNKLKYITCRNTATPTYTNRTEGTALLLESDISDFKL